MLLEDSLYKGKHFRSRTLTRRFRELTTHSTAFPKGIGRRVDLQDVAELVPVVDVLLIGSIEVVKLLLHSKLESFARSFPLRITSFPVICLAQAVKFNDG
jgi:hypothetical protein